MLISYTVLYLNLPTVLLGKKSLHHVRNDVQHSMPPRGKTSKTKKTKQKQNDLSESEVNDIKEAFELFADDETTISTSNVLNAMRALGLDPASKEESRSILATLDPDDEGVVEWDMFLEVTALKMSDRDAQEDVERAFALFDVDEKGVITIEDLRRAARELGEKVSEDDLIDMLNEASTNGRVTVVQFGEVMQRAGVL